MIPVEIRLQNFMSYGDDETVVDLTGLHTICLSGENGHGKSALLDAITWALWGETRLGRQNQEQLIRIGSDEMKVVFTFAESDQTYRVRRQRSKRAGSQLWELQQADGEGSWRPLTGVNTTDTGKAIQQIVRMSYDTFLNSAYLRQGRADEFVRQTPGKRKEILAEILELSRYDQLEAKARQRKAIAAEAALDSQRALNQIEVELAEEPAHKTALDDCQERAKRLAGERESAAAQWEKLKELSATLQSQREHAKRLENEVKQLAEEAGSWRAEIDAEQKTMGQMQALLAERKDIEEGYQKLQQARQRSAELTEKARAGQRVEKEKMALESEIEKARYDLQSRLVALEVDHKAQRVQIDELPLLCKQTEALRKRLADFDVLEQEEAKLRTSREEHSAQFAELKTKKQYDDEKLKAAEERLQRIAEQTEACSVCGSPLPQEKIAALRDEVERQIVALKNEQQDLAKDGRACKQEMEQITKRLAEIAQALTGAQELRDEIGRKDQMIQDRQVLATELPALEKQIAALRDDLADGRFAKDARRRLETVLREAKDYEGVDRELDEAAKLARTFAATEVQFHALNHAQEKLDTCQKRVAKAERQCELLAARELERQAEREALAGIEPKFLETQQVIAQLNSYIGDLTQQANKIEQERGRLQQILARCEQLKHDKERLSCELQKARKEEEAYNQLAGAFGKRGVQALIIEKAIPELQDEANDLLERITDGDMSVSIQTTRAAKSKAAGDSPIETLDIHVSDNLGTRPLENYSGGESFRISFALRIALSNLLARRAGANLQTLIIDEGFGTQDAKGREKLVDAINAIKDEFAKIIVVTHIDELKEAFPSRIEVVKTPHGSEVSILEGGIIG